VKNPKTKIKMKPKSEIITQLIETKKELEEAQQWANNAYEKYCNDKKNWGEGDYGETDAAHSVVNTLTSKINTLRWVLELHP